MSFGGTKGRETLTATNTSSSVALPVQEIVDASGNGITTKIYGHQVTIFNDGDADVFVNLGKSNVVATTGLDSSLILNNNMEVFPFDNEIHTHLAAITASGTAALRITITDGVTRITL